MLHQNCPIGGVEKLTRADDLRHALQENRIHLDDADILCHLALVLPILQLFDSAEPKIGAEIKSTETEVVHHVSDRVTSSYWKISEIRALAPVATDQLLANEKVIRAMHERVQLYQDSQTECAQKQSHFQGAWPHDSDRGDGGQDLLARITRKNSSRFCRR